MCLLVSFSLSQTTSDLKSFFHFNTNIQKCYLYLLCCPVKKRTCIMLSAESLRLSLELVNGLCLESVYVLKINHWYYSFALRYMPGLVIKECS